MLLILMAAAAVSAVTNYLSHEPFTEVLIILAVVLLNAVLGVIQESKAEAAIEAARSTKTVPMHTFSGPVEHAIAHIEEAAVHKMPEEQQRWYAIKIFERDDKVLAKLHIPEDVHAHIEADIKAAEEELDDDAESIITNERYVYIAEVIRACYRKKSKATQSASDKIDRIVTNRWLGLPIFAVVMFLVYWVAMVAVGAPATDWANDGVFGDGWHLLGIGSGAYSDANDEYTAATEAVDAFLGLDTEAEDFDADAALADVQRLVASIADADYRSVAETMLARHLDAFRRIPAGKTVHHSFLSGLLMHTYNMLRAADFLAGLYPEVIDRSLLLTGTLLHDFAKEREFVFSDLGIVTEYSTAGQLLGHLVMGAQEVADVARELAIAEEKSLLLQHLLLSCSPS